MQHRKSNDNNIIEELYLTLFTIITFALIIYFLKRLSFKIPAIYFSKKELSKLYNINKRTITKWLDCFLSSELKNNIAGRRLIQADVAVAIIFELGSPVDFPVLSRKEIIYIGEGNYRQLVKVIEHIIYIENLAEDARSKLKNIRVFPPFFSQRLANDFGLHETEISLFIREKHHNVV